MGPPPPLIKDARYFQIAALVGMLLYGIEARDFPIPPVAVASVLGAVVLTQLFAIVLWRITLTSLLSALISGLSVLLLCRTNLLLAWSAVGVIAIMSKFVFRYRTKHFFNPTNFGIIIALYLSRAAWVSPGQWGDEALFLFWILTAGGVVVMKASRQDISAAFLLSYVGLLAGRVFYLGQPAAVLVHQLANGSLIIFTFFMISDPRSTPDHRIARLVFAVLNAVVAYVLRFHFYSPNALFLALFFISPLTPILDSLWQHSRYQWGSYEKIDSAGGSTSAIRPKLRLLRFLRGQG